MPAENSRRRSLTAASLLVIAVTGGCLSDRSPFGDADFPRVAVSGSVRLHGRPLPEGRILFEIIGTEPGFTAIGDIRNGRFSIDRSRGPSAGKRRVMIFVPDTKGREGEGSPLAEESVRYTWLSTTEVEIYSEGPLIYEFDLDEKP